MMTQNRKPFRSIENVEVVEPLRTNASRDSSKARSETCRDPFEDLLDASLKLADQQNGPQGPQEPVSTIPRLLDDQCVRFETWLYETKALDSSDPSHTVELLSEIYGCLMRTKEQFQGLTDNSNPASIEMACSEIQGHMEQIDIQISSLFDPLGPILALKSSSQSLIVLRSTSKLATSVLENETEILDKVKLEEGPTSLEAPEYTHDTATPGFQSSPQSSLVDTSSKNRPDFSRMASRPDRNRRGNLDRAKEYQWSEWEWNAEKGKWYRWRYNSKNKVVWESHFSAATSEAVPRGEPSASTSTAITNPTSSATSSKQKYYDSAGYQYNDLAQEYTVVDGLTEEFASTTFREQDEVPAQAQYSYDGDRDAQQASGYPVAEEYQSAQSIDVVDPQRSSSMNNWEEVSMYSSSGRMQGYTDTTDSSFMTAPMSYDPSGPRSSYYNAQAAQYTDEDPGDDPPYLGESYGSGFTVTQATHRASKRSRSDPPAPTPPAPLRLPKYCFDLRFKVHTSKFFQPGQIFKVVWVEPAGENLRSDATSMTRAPSMTDITSMTDTASMTDVTSEAWTVQQGEYGTKVYSSVRRFVVVATKTGHSNCVPILSYGRQGLNKPGIHAEDHAIIYTTDQPPINGDSHVNTPIQMQSKSPRDRLEPISLVNYAKIYPVEHNVKVQFIGWIAKNSQLDFARDFDYVWNSHKQLR